MLSPPSRIPSLRSLHSSWLCVSFIPFGSRLDNEGKRTFETNLQDLRTLCRDHRFPVILSSQVSNLQGYPPFVSRRPDDLRPEDRQAIDAAIAAGETAIKNLDWETAIQKFTAAASADSLHAGTRFAIACCLDASGRRDEARREYVKARVFHQLRFRTSCDFNLLITQMEDSTTVGVAEMEGLFMAHSPDSLIGNELMLEHVHPNSAGYFLMAGEYAAVMRRRGLFASPDEWTRNDTIECRIDTFIPSVRARVAARRCGSPPSETGNQCRRPYTRLYCRCGCGSFPLTYRRIYRLLFLEEHFLFPADHRRRADDQEHAKSIPCQSDECKQ